MMTSVEFVRMANAIQRNYKTDYMLGTFGSQITEDLIYGKAKQLPDYYKPTVIAALKQHVGKEVWAFDCVGLIKGILWGWTGDVNKSRGGAAYASNDVPDTNADGMIAKCHDASNDFSGIKAGEVVWMPGHIGIYVGNGNVVESTPRWDGGVQVSKLCNTGYRGTKCRTWTKHGSLPYVNYIKEETELPNINELTDKQVEELWNKLMKPLQDNDHEDYSAAGREWCIKNKIIGGSGGATPNYQWEAPLTREQFCTMLHRFAQYIGKA